MYSPAIHDWVRASPEVISGELVSIEYVNLPSQDAHRVARGQVPQLKGLTVQLLGLAAGEE